MKTGTMLAAAAMLALTACDRIPFLQGDEPEISGNVVAANASGNASASTGPSDAGITSSRSLSGLGGNAGGQGGQGGKDPQAVPAGAPSGGVDPRFVGRWSDDGSCKDISELRADGTFVAPNGAQGRWQVAGDQLIFSGPGGEFRLRINSVAADRIVTTNNEGNTGATRRC